MPSGFAFVTTGPTTSSPGRTSPCHPPRSWTARRADATAHPYSAARPPGIAPPTSFSSEPMSAESAGTSRTAYACPSYTPASSTGSRFACANVPNVRARLTTAVASSVGANAAGSSRRSTSGVRSDGCSARYAVPPGHGPSASMTG